MSLNMLQPKLDARLRINEIFYSLQGESTRVGLPTVFVRLTGCPLRCSWCDSEYAFKEGEMLDVAEILAKVKSYECATVCVTGGEPLAQPACLELLVALCNAGYSVSLETSGALDVGAVDNRVSRIVDLKAPSSGEEARNFWPNLGKLNARDEIKIIIASLEDYEWACAVLQRHHLEQICTVLLSPAQDEMNPTQLAEWILRDRLPVRFQLQMHKLLWGAERAR